MEGAAVGEADGEARGDAGEVVRRRRWPVAVAAVLAAVVAVGCWGWFWWLPGYRPGLEAGERYGVDVSNHQGDVDWERVADDGIEFAYIKATEGRDFLDARFATNWSEAGRRGIDRGAPLYVTGWPGRCQPVSPDYTLRAGSSPSPGTRLRPAPGYGTV